MTETDFEARLTGLRHDRQHGAAELAREALRIAAAEARASGATDRDALLHHLREVARRLAGVRPSMAPVANLAGSWIATVEASLPATLEELRTAAAAAADLAIEKSESAAAAAAAQATALVPDGATIMTHSLSSTVTSMFRNLRGRSVKAVITESRPGKEGHLLAARLSDWNIPTTVIVDAAMALFVPKATLVVVGADSILPDGSVVNKAGTSLLALAAREHHVPFYVCAEEFKRLRDDLPPPDLEAMDPAELGIPALPGVTAANLYFDITPGPLITAILTGEENSAPGDE